MAQLTIRIPHPNAKFSSQELIFKNGDDSNEVGRFNLMSFWCENKTSKKSQFFFLRLALSSVRLSGFSLEKI